MSLADFRSVVPRLVRCQDAELITPQDVDRALETALRQLSTDAPRQLVRDITWGATPYVADAPEGFVETSRILTAEYPLGQTPPHTIGLTATLLPPADLAVMSDTPVGALETVRVTFTAEYVLTGTQDTVPAQYRDALNSLAAHLLCRELAAYYSADRESSIGADASQTDSRARAYAQRAKEYRADYYARLGLRDPMLAGGSSGSAGGSSAGPVAGGAGAVATWPSRSRHTLTHLVR